jgi:hypothetical protein
MSCFDEVPFKTLVGKTPTKITVDPEKTEILFVMSDGTQYMMYHMQDCCESVYIEDICGDLQRLIGHEIEIAEESSSSEFPPAKEMGDESFTWTFYKLVGNWEYVTIRWYGSSTGYYGESAELVWVNKPESELN